jgi:hypothetical protein
MPGGRGTIRRASARAVEELLSEGEG